nr:MAG TPA: hypothetical protein [Caudoviricetes sp.]
MYTRFRVYINNLVGSDLRPGLSVEIAIFL